MTLVFRRNCTFCLSNIMIVRFWSLKFQLHDFRLPGINCAILVSYVSIVRFWFPSIMMVWFWSPCSPIITIRFFCHRDIFNTQSMWHMYDWFDIESVHLWSCMFLELKMTQWQRDLIVIIGILGGKNRTTIILGGLKLHNHDMWAIKIVQLKLVEPKSHNCDTWGSKSALHHSFYYIGCSK